MQFLQYCRFPEMWSVVFLFVSVACIKTIDVAASNGTEFPPEAKHSAQACHNKIIGPRGVIYSSLVSYPNYTCSWDLDVTKGFVAVLEFEYIRFPDNEDGSCESNVQISYGSEKDQIRRRFCSGNKLDRIYTDSQQVLIQVVYLGTCHKRCNEEFGFKIRYSGVAISKSAWENHIWIIVLLILCIILSLALCAFCFSCHSKRQREIASREVTRQPLEDITEFQRHVEQMPLQAPRKLSFSIFQSENSKDSSNQRRWTTKSHTDRNRYCGATIPGRNISIATTPRSSFFPDLRRKWSDSNVERIQHLKTRLVSRFSTSSHNSADISVYFNTSDRSYSQLRSEEEDQHENQDERNNINDSRPTSNSGGIPSIVVELVE